MCVETLREIIRQITIKFELSEIAEVTVLYRSAMFYVVLCLIVKTCLSVTIDRCSYFLVRYLFLYLNDIIYGYTMKRLRKMEERED